MLYWTNPLPSYVRMRPDTYARCGSGLVFTRLPTLPRESRAIPTKVYHLPYAVDDNHQPDQPWSSPYKDPGSPPSEIVPRLAHFPAHGHGHVACSMRRSSPILLTHCPSSSLALASSPASLLLNSCPRRKTFASLPNPPLSLPLSKTSCSPCQGHICSEGRRD